VDHHPDWSRHPHVGTVRRAMDALTALDNDVGIFEFRDGLLSLWREYDDPMIVVAAQAEHAAARARSAP
jgi:hypothetical protein